MKVSVLGIASCVLFLLLPAVSLALRAPPPGSCSEDYPCPPGQCCSQWGFCGTGPPYCGDQPPPPPPDDGDDTDAGELGKIITKELFDEMLMHRNDSVCPASGFYTYNAFINASKLFPDFGTTGDEDSRKREVAAFFAQTSHETTGGWATAPDGPYTWGYCFLRENGGDYCDPTSNYKCVPGQQYYGRGPIQLSWNYNYGQCGEAINQDLLNNADLVATDRVISFETAFWFWMTPQPPKPSCHDVIVGNFVPSAADIKANRLPGFGLTINIINGGLECGIKNDPRANDRIGFYLRYCKMLGVDPGEHIDCEDQGPYGYGNLKMVVNSK